MSQLILGVEGMAVSTKSASPPHKTYALEDNNGTKEPTCETATGETAHRAHMKIAFLHLQIFCSSASVMQADPHPLTQEQTRVLHR